MIGIPRSSSTRPGLGARTRGAAVPLVLAFACQAVWAQEASTNAAPAVKAAVKPSEAAWRSLSAAQRAALRPLQAEWPRLDSVRRQKWLEIADRFPSMPVDEQERVQARMTDWASLSPEDRGKARLLFQQAKEVAPSDRGSKWSAYQSLPEDERDRLTQRAVSAAKPVASGAAAATGRRPTSAELSRRRADEPRPAGKSNLVPNPGFAAPPTPVAPTVTRAGPGATTSLMSRRANPPAHEQPGLPKIAAMPGFVDPVTLLPKRGPQAAAATPPTPPAQVPRP